MTDFPPPIAPASPPLPSSVEPARTWWNRKLWKVPVWGWVSVAVLVIGGAASAASKNKAEDAVTSQSTAPSSESAPTAPGAIAPPADCSGLACQMTRDSGIHGIPLPADAVKDASSASGLQITSAGTLEEVTAFYHDYLTTHGWTFEPEFSELDPKVAETKSLGHISNGIYCKSTTPITTVAVIVGIVGSGPKVEIGLVDDAGEASCP